MPDSDPIVHQYETKDIAELKKLVELAQARCRVSVKTVIGQPHQSGLLIVFFRNQAVPAAVLEILDGSGQPKDIIELSKPMEEYEVKSLAEIGEISVPRVLTSMGKDNAIATIESYHGEVEETMGKINVYNRGMDDIIITMTDGQVIKVPHGEWKTGIVTLKIASVTN